MYFYVDFSGNYGFLKCMWVIYEVFVKGFDECGGSVFLYLWFEVFIVWISLWMDDIKCCDWKCEFFVNFIDNVGFLFFMGEVYFF